MSVLNAIWLTGRLVVTALEIYVLYVYATDGWRVGAAWKVLRGRAGIVEASPQAIAALRRESEAGRAASTGGQQ